MGNRWLGIPLADYEGHMALPQVAQAQLLGDVFAGLLGRNAPRSVAVLGCAGGNGFERITPAVTTRVVGIDVNPAYIAAARARFAERLPGLELYVADIQVAEHNCAPVELAFAGLLFEYVDVGLALRRIRALLIPGGILGTVVQLPCAARAVTPSPYTSLQTLEPVMHLIAPAELAAMAAAEGYQLIDARESATAAGKRFAVQTFRRNVASA